ncbi:MAG TPA: hypothetical protein VLH56_12100 [Dissulfurispiraceae bacterium]|nr:hypothetical protein [Dissulfurispiraceae bacterium]
MKDLPNKEVDKEAAIGQDDVGCRLERSPYNKLLVPCFTFRGMQYLTNQDGGFDVYHEESPLVPENRIGKVTRDAPEVKVMLLLHKFARKK